MLSECAQSKLAIVEVRDCVIVPSWILLDLVQLDVLFAVASYLLFERLFKSLQVEHLDPVFTLISLGNRDGPG